MTKWNKRFIGIVKEVASWSSCLRHQVGCVVVRDNRILATGYNGAPMGCKTCVEKNECYRNANNIPSGENSHLCFAAHAEQNAIAQAAFMGSCFKGAELYVTHQPCSMCARLIINSGIKTVYFLTPYPDRFADMLFEESGVMVVQLKETENT